jgi:predicted nucleic acid-binding protein
VSLVVDASITVAWIYSDETGEAVEAVFDRVNSSGAWVPGIWRLEVANALAQGIRRGRITAAVWDASLADLANLNIATDLQTESFAWTTTLAFADRFGLTLYDACYLELAQRRELPLATLDGDLRKAAGELELSLLGM